MLGIGKKKGRPPSDLRQEDDSRSAAEDEEARIDEVVAGSFPASDPPSWTLGDERRVRPEGRRSAAKKK